MRVTIRFVTDAIRLFAAGGVHDGSCHGDALLMHDETVGTSIWFLGSYDDAVKYAKDRFAGAAKVFVLR